MSVRRPYLSFCLPQTAMTGVPITACLLKNAAGCNNMYEYSYWFMSIQNI